jgi:hypothetical protein
MSFRDLFAIIFVCCMPNELGRKMRLAVKLHFKPTISNASNERDINNQTTDPYGCNAIYRAVVEHFDLSDPLVERSIEVSLTDYVELYSTNSFGVNVHDLLRVSFPNLKIIVSAKAC